MKTQACPHCQLEVKAGAPFLSHVRACEKFPGIDELQRMWHRGMSVQLMARQCAVSPWLVRNWLAQHRVKKRRDVMRYTWSRGGVKALRDDLDTGIRYPQGTAGGCKKACPVYDLCVETVQLGLLLCEIPDQPQVDHLARRGVDVVGIMKAVKGLG